MNVTHMITAFHTITDALIDLRRETPRRITIEEYRHLIWRAADLAAEVEGLSRAEWPEYYIREVLRYFYMVGNLTQESIARLLRCSPAHVSKVLNGKSGSRLWSFEYSRWFEVVAGKSSPFPGQADSSPFGTGPLPTLSTASKAHA